MSLWLLPSLLSACNSEAIALACFDTNSEPSIAPDAPSSLGFSAREVLSALELSFDVSTVDQHDDTTVVRPFSFTFEVEDEVWVEERYRPSLREAPATSASPVRA